MKGEGHKGTTAELLIHFASCSNPGSPKESLASRAYSLKRLNMKSDAKLFYVVLVDVVDFVLAKESFPLGWV